MTPQEIDRKCEAASGYAAEWRKGQVYPPVFSSATLETREPSPVREGLTPSAGVHNLPEQETERTR